MDQGAGGAPAGVVTPRDNRVIPVWATCPASAVWVGALASVWGRAYEWPSPPRSEQVSEPTSQEVEALARESHLAMVVATIAQSGYVPLRDSVPTAQV
jgi:hypothetical protein